MRKRLSDIKAQSSGFLKPIKEESELKELIK